MINARQLEVLTTVIKTGSTSGAAKVLHVSQPAVSNMIRHMESISGLVLFNRAHGRLVPTKEAQYIAKEARELFMQQKRIQTVVSELRDGTTGTLSIIATPSLGLGTLPKALSKFTRDRPKLRISLELGSIDEIIDMLTSGQADLGFSITLPRHSALSVSPIAYGRMVCVCPPDHAFVKVEKVRVVDLNSTTHISYGALTPLGQLVDQVFSDHGLKREYSCEVRHTATALELAARGFGAALVDSFAIFDRDDLSVAVRETEPTLPIQLYSILPKSFPTSNVAAEFLTLFTEYYGQDSGVPASP